MNASHRNDGCASSARTIGSSLGLPDRKPKASGRGRLSSRGETRMPTRDVASLLDEAELICPTVVSLILGTRGEVARGELNGWGG